MDLEGVELLFEHRLATWLEIRFIARLKRMSKMQSIFC